VSEFVEIKLKRDWNIPGFIINGAAGLPERYPCVVLGIEPYVKDAFVVRLTPPGAYQESAMWVVGFDNVVTAIEP
jgi:hypothetical protein